MHYFGVITYRASWFIAVREIGFSEAIHFVPLFLMSVLLATTPEASGHRCGTMKFYFTLDCHRKQFVPIERVHSAVALLPPLLYLEK